MSTLTAGYALGVGIVQEFLDENADAIYDPTDVSTLYEDSAGTTPASVGSPVGRMEDISGGGHHATQSTTADKPTFREDVNGRLYLEYALGDSLDTGIENADIATPYALPSIGGATLRYTGVSGSFAIRQTTGPLAVVAADVGEDVAQALADYYQDEAMSYADATITSLYEHLRDQGSLTSLPGAEGWDVSSVTNMFGMFRSTSVSDLSPLSEWDVSSVTRMDGMFNGTSVTDLSPLSGWDVANVTDMRAMFNRTSVTDLSPLSGWDVANVTDMGGMFEGAPLDDVPTGDMLDGWTDGSPNLASDLQSGVTLGIPNADYSQMDTGGQDAVNALCSNQNWTINAANAPADCS